MDALNLGFCLRDRRKPVYGSSVRREWVRIVIYISLSG